MSKKKRLLQKIILFSLIYCLDSKTNAVSQELLTNYEQLLKNSNGYQQNGLSQGSVQSNDKLNNFFQNIRSLNENSDGLPALNYGDKAFILSPSKKVTELNLPSFNYNTYKRPVTNEINPLISSLYSTINQNYVTPNVGFGNQFYDPSESYYNTINTLNYLSPSYDGFDQYGYLDDLNYNQLGLNDFASNYINPNEFNLSQNFKQSESIPVLLDLNGNNDPPTAKYAPNPKLSQQKQLDFSSFLKTKPDVIESILTNNLFGITSDVTKLSPEQKDDLLNEFVIKANEKPNSRLKTFRNKVTVKRIVPRGQQMTGPVFDPASQMLYFPFMKVLGEEYFKNNEGKTKITENKLKSYMMEPEGEMRTGPNDLYDPPVEHPPDQDVVGVLPPFKVEDAPNDPKKLAVYMPDYQFTDFWTYDKPIVQDDCPHYAIKIAGVCVNFPPHRKFLF